MICVNCNSILEDYSNQQSLKDVVKYACRKCNYSNIEPNSFVLWLNSKTSKIIYFHWENYSFSKRIVSASIGLLYTYSPFYEYYEYIHDPNKGIVYTTSFNASHFVPPKELTIPSILETFKKAKTLENFK